MDPRFLVSGGADPYKTFTPNLDVTEILSKAASTLTFENSMIASSHFNPETALHVIELMDARMDPCAVADPSSGNKLPSVRERIENGSLPLPVDLGIKEATRVLDHMLLQIYPSFLHGNSAPQTLMSSLYLHPTSLATLAAQTGRPSLYLHTRAPGAETIVPPHNLHFAEISETKSPLTPTTLQPAVVPSKSQSTSEIDQAITLSFFATCLGVLKVSGVTYEQILFSDIFEEEDFHPLTYGADMAWTVPLDQILKTLFDAERAMIKSFPGAGAAAQAMVDAASTDRDKVLNGASIQPGGVSSDLSSVVSALFDLNEANTRPSVIPPQLTSLLSNLSIISTSSEESLRGKKGAKKAGAKVVTSSDTAKVPEPSSSTAPLVPEPFHSHDLFSINPLPDTGASSLSSLADAAALIIRMRFLRVYHIALEYFSPRHTTPAKAPLKWGQLFPLNQGHAAFVSAWLHMEVIAATTSLVQTTPLGKAHEARILLENLLESESTTATGVQESSLKKQNKNSKRNPSKNGTVAKEAPLVPGFFPEYDKLFLTNNRPRFVPFADAPSSIKLWQRHLCASVFVTQFPALASHNPHRPMSTLANVGAPFVVSPATVSLSSLLTTSRAMQSSATSGREVPLPVVPDSGIIDSPLQWPSPFAAVEASLAKSGENKVVSEALKEDQAAAAANAVSRRHVSLFAVHSLLELFSRRNADVLARSLLIRTVLCGGSVEEMDKASASVRDPDSTPSTLSGSLDPSTETNENELKLLQAGDVAWRQGHVRSQVVVGTHTLLELVYASMKDVGTPSELLFTVEGRSFLELTESVMAATLRLLQCSRSRMRQQMSLNVREWAIVCNDSEYLSKLWSKQYEIHQKRLEKTSLSDLTPEQTADLRLFYIYNSQKKLIDTVSCWTDYFAMTSLLLHTRIGIESGLYHTDETLSVQWQILHLLRRLIRSGSYIEIGRTIAWIMPELDSISSHMLNEFKNTGEAHLYPVDLRDTVDEEGEAATSSDAGGSGLVDPSWTEYMDKIMNVAIRRRSAFVESAMRNSEALHAEAVLRVLTSAKMCGVWNGLGVEGCGPRTDEELNSASFSMMQRNFRWTVPPFNPHTHAPFRLPSVAFSLRWELFREFPPLAREGNFAKYMLLFSAAANSENQLTLANQGLSYGRECVKTLRRVQELCTIILADRDDVLRENPPPPPSSTEQIPPCAPTSYTILMAGYEMNHSLIIETSTNSVLAVAEEFSNIDQIVALADQKPQAIKSNFSLPVGLKHLRDYRSKIVDEEQAKWELKGCTSGRTGCSTTPDDLKKAQVRHAVAQRKLELFEKEMAALHAKEVQHGQAQKKLTDKSKPSSSLTRIEPTAAVESPSLASVSLLPHRQSLSSPSLYHLLQISSELIAVIRQNIATIKAQGALEGESSSSEGITTVRVPTSVSEVKSTVLDDSSMAAGGSSGSSSSSLSTITVSEAAPNHPCKLKVGVVAPYFVDVGFSLPLSSESIRLLANN